MIPDAEKSTKKTPEEIKELILRTKHSSAWCARKIGITPIQLYNITRGKSSCSYPIQFALECLAYAYERIKS